MAFYLIKNGGTATGDGGRVTVAPTGSFASLATSAYYDDIDAAEAATTPNAPGDFYMLSDLHVDTRTTQFVGTSAAANVLNAFCIISVDDTDLEKYKAGAILVYSRSEQHIDYFGIHWKTSPIALIQLSFINMTDCKLEFTGTGEISTSFSLTSSYRITDSTIICTSTANNFSCHSDASLIVRGVDITSTVGDIDHLINVASAGTLLMSWCDVSVFKNALFSGTINAASNNHISNCRLHPTLTTISEATISVGKPDIDWTVRACGSTDLEVQTQEYYQAVGGTVEDQDSSGIHRSSSVATRPDEFLYSLKIETTSLCNLGGRFMYELPTRYVELSQATSNKLRFYIATKQTLTDTNFWLTAYYPDDAANSDTVTVQARNLMVIDAGTELTTDPSSAWVNTTTENTYIVDLDLSAVTGADSVPSIFVSIGIDTSVSGDPIYMGSNFDVMGA